MGLSLIALVSCASDFEPLPSILESNEESPAPELTLAFSASPFDTSSAPSYYASDVNYGSLSSQVFDLWIPKSQFDAKTPTSLVVFIHGGGFTSGDKTDIWSGSATMQATIRTLLNNGIAFATINYPLLAASGETEGAIKSLRSSRRAVQFFRYYANSLNLSKKIVLMGSSAGASTSLWIGLSNDMANASSTDPVERQSTRVSAIVATETQATLDLVRWESIFSTYSFSLSSISSTATRFYGASSFAEITNSTYTTYRDGVDMLDLMDSGDPELWVNNDNVPEVAPSTSSILFHHPYHAKALKDRAATVGLNGQFYISNLGISDPANETMTSFLVRKAAP